MRTVFGNKPIIGLFDPEPRLNQFGFRKENLSDESVFDDPVLYRVSDHAVFINAGPGILIAFRFQDLYNVIQDFFLVADEFAFGLFPAESETLIHQRVTVAASVIRGFPSEGFSIVFTVFVSFFY